MAAGTAPDDALTTPLRGARTSCALLTLLTILLAWPQPPMVVVVCVRPAYFGLLTWFFWRTTRISPELQGQAMRLVWFGFLVLTLGATLSAGILVAELEVLHGAFIYLRQTCEHGALFLLGTTLIAYGLMLWLPQVLASHRLLAEHTTRQRGELHAAEHTRSRLEQRLVDADRRGMLGELAASIAHDLRNPLTIVAGTAESLCRRPRTAAEIVEHTQVIRRNIDKASRTIQSLIDLARPRAQAATELDAFAALRELAGLLQVEARRRRVELRVPDGAGPRLHTDHTLLMQALLNLALNAVQASPPGAPVTLLARAFGGNPRRIAFVIADRGSGLSPTVRAQLFTPFFTTKPDGTGLGLASCRRIASELGGTLRLRPRTAGGARAVLWLPVHWATNSAPGPAAADEAAAWATTSC
jgi:signal transduction histidine kinase